MARAKVAVLKTHPDSVLEDIPRLMKMADYQKYLDPNETVILKDNISWHLLFPGANTTPWQLEGTILGLQRGGYNDITCVQNETVVTDAFKGEKLNKYRPIFDHYNIPVLYNFLKKDIKWEVYLTKAEMLTLPKIYPDGILIPDYFHNKNILHLPTVKTHIYTTTTGAMKNAFGGLLNTRRHYTHSVIHETLVDLLAIQKEIHSGIFTVMDGTTCGSGPGPRTMKPHEKNIMLASGDSTAIDAVAAKIMGFDPMSIKFIRLAHERGLGVGEINEIEIVGEDISDWNFNFEVGDNVASLAGDLFWFSPLKIFQKLLFHTPLVYAFIYASAVYHDNIWYPKTGIKIVNEWKRTLWGKYFENYQPGASISSK
ncbi:DUF362 domain-containing protein [bacterium]|nr:DUF362 domain-containing protein [bacterium]